MHFLTFNILQFSLYHIILYFRLTETLQSVIDAAESVDAGDDVSWGNRVRVKVNRKVNVNVNDDRGEKKEEERGQMRKREEE